jgi:hypothetical protein
MRFACLLSLAFVTAPAAEENVTVRLRGALVEFDGAQYAFYPRGSIHWA